MFNFNSINHDHLKDILNVIHRDIANDERKLNNNESEDIQRSILTY
jgi:hypothetical protein